MSPAWTTELRVGVCPGRLAVARYRRHLRRRLVEATTAPVENDVSAALAKLAGHRRVSVVLSNHFVRYALLPWAAALRSEQDWLEFAHHSFLLSYGEPARAWHVKTCSTGPRQARLACAFDPLLLQSLKGVRAVASVQPFLMSAFNARRRHLGGRAAWFALQEEGRLTAALLVQGVWKIVRSRQAHGDWRKLLPQLLDREQAAAPGLDCTDVLICSESEAPAQLGRYHLTDITLPAGTAPSARTAAMALS